MVLLDISNTHPELNTSLNWTVTQLTSQPHFIHNQDACELDKPFENTSPP